MITDTTSVEQDLRRRVTVAVVAMVAVVVLGVVGFTILAPETSLLDRVYMTVVTLTTVGYGEIISTEGQPALKIFTMLLMVFGMGFLLFSVTTLTATLVEVDLADVFRRRRMDKQLAAMHQHFIVCGGGETGIHIVDELLATHTPFVVIEEDPARCQMLHEHDEAIIVLHGDGTDEEVLTKAGISRARGLCAALPNDKDNLFLTLTARGLNENLRIVARGVSASTLTKLRKAGADTVVSPTMIGGLRMASELMRPHTVSFLDQMLRQQSTEMHRFGELPVAPDCSWVGKQLRELPLQDRRLLVVALRHPDGRFEYVPPADLVLPADSALIVLGNTEIIAQIRRELEPTAAA